MQNTKKVENYSIGLDIGTTSVGWAVINDDYSLVRVSQRNMWGVNLFDEGMPAKDRRAKRSQRRRLERRKQRIVTLRKLMEDDVLKLDPSFFIRMDESYLHCNDDFGRKNKYNLFEDKLFTDKQFYENYPSIYHLRKALITDKEKFDIRLVYLAIHHIIKYRGNFLYEGNADEFKGYDIGFIESYFNELENNSLYLDNIKDIEAILLDPNKKRKEKVEAIKSSFSSKDEQNFITQFSNAALGLKFDLGVVVNQDIKDEDNKPLKISFSDASYEEKVDEYTNLAGDNAPLLGALYTLYFALTFKEILGNNDFISYAMCDKYDLHKEDLYALKGLMKEFCDEKSYTQFFTSKENKAKDAVCYHNYIHRTSSLKGNNKTPNQILIEEAFKLLEKTTRKQDLKADERYIKLLEKKELRELLPRLNSKANSTIPYQMNCKELKIILENQSKYYPSLKENADKIISLLTFRRPYYVGVLNKNSKFNWYDKPIDGKVEPWNFDKKIDLEYAQEKFIQNLTNNCSIFPNEPVLPLNSFLYSEYMVLDELNKIKIKGNLMSTQIKNKIFEDLFCSSNAKTKVTKKDIIIWFKNNENLILSAEDISGLHEEDSFANIYKPYRDFKRILGDNFKDKKISLYEEIVKTNTIFSDSQTRINRIKNTFAKDKDHCISEKQIKSLAKINYSGWGRFSEKVLNGIYSVEENRRTIIQILRDTTQNFMEIKFDKHYGFEAQMQPQKKELSDFYKDCIEKSYCSPAVKKATNQAVKIIEEIIKIMGHAPLAIYIESASGEEINKKGNRTKSKSDSLKELYSNVTKDLRNEDYDYANNELKSRIEDEKARNVKSADSAFNKERLYLYFTQLGKCMYSGDNLDISQLDKYEVDHIIPQSLIKDDSRDNKVLVKKIENQNKNNNLTLNKDIIEKMKPLWSKLLKMKFISKRKYDALTRETFDERDVEKFINRQLVETRQIVKEVGNIIQMLPELDGCNIVKVPAKSCDNLKSGLGYFKVRNLNDYHHAKDAYIASVFGRFTQNTIGKNNGDFQKLYHKGIWMSLKSGGKGKTQKLRHGLVANMINLKFDSILHVANEEYDENGNLMRQELQMLSPEGEIIWSSTYRDTVLKTLNYNDCMLTKKIEEWANADFYNETIYLKGSPNAKISRKMATNKFGKKVDLPTKDYGGNSSISSAYAMAIEYRKGKKIERKIVNIPLINVYKNNVDEYLKKIYGEYKVLKERICKNQMILYKNQLCYYVSESELNNATQIKGKQYWQEALSKIAKANEKKTTLKKDNMTDEEYDKINRQMRAFVDDFLYQLEKYFPLYNSIAKHIQQNYVRKGGFDALSFDLKQSFIIELSKITSTAGRTDKLKDKCFNVNVKGEELAIKGSSLGRLSIALNLDDIIFVNRSITGFWETKISASELGKDKD
ncbi:MAG: type II CRISPR RNA-guided endonuclease Cas9 [Clostridia bacterium]|nr:type II CRISPR RNA-guided endonuclease Cas9 [Clostridia bacterium]